MRAQAAALGDYCNGSAVSLELGNAAVQKPRNRYGLTSQMERCLIGFCFLAAREDYFPPHYHH